MRKEVIDCIRIPRVVVPRGRWRVHFLFATPGDIMWENEEEKLFSLLAMHHHPSPDSERNFFLKKAHWPPSVVGGAHRQLLFCARVFRPVAVAAAAARAN